MNILITPKEQICKELTDIDSFLNITMSENAEEAVLRGNDLAVYVARSGKLLADAKYWLNEAMNSETMKTLAETAKNAKATDKNAKRPRSTQILALASYSHYPNGIRRKHYWIPIHHGSRYNHISIY